MHELTPNAMILTNSSILLAIRLRNRATNDKTNLNTRVLTVTLQERACEQGAIEFLPS
jgi:hypothetical protein